MRARLVMIAALTLATSASAEPAKKTPAESAPSARPTVVLAAAEQGANSGSNEQSTPAPVKRPRAARVSSCRCGDPQTQPQDE